VLLLTFAAGCKVGPNFKRPRAGVPGGWVGPGGDSSGLASVTTAARVEVIEWWTTFDDPILDSLVERAVESNLDLRLATSRIRQARAVRGVVSSPLYPNVDVSGSYRRSGSIGSDDSDGGTDDNGTGGGFGGGGDRSLFQAGLDAAWELDVFGGIARDVEAAEADIQSAVEDRRDVLVTLASEVALNYIDLRSFQRQLAIARRNLADQLRNADLTRELFEGGFIPSLDVANAEAQVASTQSQIPSVESATRQAIYNLSVLLGQEPGALLEELTPEAPIPPTPPQVPVGLPSDLLRRRPDIRRAEADLHSATARVGVATADLFPRFSLTGSLGLEGDKAKSLTNWNNNFFSVGPSVSWPVFDAGRIRSNIEVQNAVQEQALIAYEATVLTALRDVEVALIAYAKEQQRREALVDAVAANRRAVDLATRLYRNGDTDFLNVLSAQRSLLVSEDALAQSNRTVSTNLVALYKALGGGWEIQP
jgi:NodT family efflux transporter outer membrane factor (OMF) lipoprotein